MVGNFFENFRLSELWWGELAWHSEPENLTPINLVVYSCFPMQSTANGSRKCRSPERPPWWDPPAHPLLPSSARGRADLCTSPELAPSLEARKAPAHNRNNNTDICRTSTWFCGPTTTSPPQQDRALPPRHVRDQVWHVWWRRRGLHPSLDRPCITVQCPMALAQHLWQWGRRDAMVSTTWAPILAVPDEARSLRHRVQCKLCPLLKLPCLARTQDREMWPLGGVGDGLTITETTEHRWLQLLPKLALPDFCSTVGLAVAGHPFCWEDSTTWEHAGLAGGVC